MYFFLTFIWWISKCFKIKYANPAFFRFRNNILKFTLALRSLGWSIYLEHGKLIGIPYSSSLRALAQGRVRIRGSSLKGNPQLQRRKLSGINKDKFPVPLEHIPWDITFQIEKAQKNLSAPCPARGVFIFEY